MGLWEWDLRTNEVQFSNEWRRQLGYGPDEIPNEYSTWEARVHPDDLPRIKKHLAEYLAKPWPDYEAEFRMRHRDGSWRWILAQADLLNDGNGQPTHMVGSHIDITELKQGDAERRAHLRFFEVMDQVNRAIQRAESPEQMMSEVLESLLTIFECDRAWLVYPCDPAAPTWRVPMERTRPEYPGGFAAGIDFPMDAAVGHVMALVRKANGPMKFRPGIDLPLLPVAEEYQVRSFIAMALYPKGDKPYMFGLHQCSYAREWTPEDEELFDAIGRRLTDSLTSLVASRNLQQSQQALKLFRALIDRATDTIEVVDPETGRFLDVNERACQVHGYSREEYLRMHVPDVEVGIDLTSPGVWAAQIDRIRQAGSRAFLGVHRRKDGSIFPVEVNANYITLDRDYVISVVRDITERKAAEEALRESEQRFRQVTESIDEVFWLTDAIKNETIYISPAYEKVWGRSCKHLYEAPHSWIDAVHPDDRTRVSEARSNLQNAGDYDMEYRIERPDGAVRWIHDRAFPIKDGAGCVYRMVGVAEDVTARRQLEDQVRHSQKMDAVGRLAGGIAHDFNNLLSAIQMQAELLLETAPAEGETREGIDDIIKAADRATQLTRQLLTFSRRNVKETRDLDLGEVIGSMTKLLLRLLGEDFSLESRLAPSLPAVNADQGMVEQVLLNLVVNARDAMPKGGRLLVSLDAVDIDADSAAGKPGVTPGRFVCLAVSDTGCGIAPENLSRIFEPFFTTKEIGRGTGLGLAIVFGIVEQHHGWVGVESTLGQGTTFRIYLPANAAAPARRRLVRPITPVRGGSETILLVEDEPMVRALTRSVLERFGYRVIAAESGAMALQMWENPGTQVDLLLTDLVMPGGISGRELADVLISRQPSLRIIYTSGYSPDAVDHQLPLGQGRRFLPKPCSASDLAANVRSCLDEAVSGG